MYPKGESWNDVLEISVEKRLLYWVSGFSSELSNIFSDSDALYSYLSELEEFYRTFLPIFADNQRRFAILLDFFKEKIDLLHNISPFSPALVILWEEWKNEWNFKTFIKSVVENLPKKRPSSYEDHVINSEEDGNLLRKHCQGLYDNIKSKWEDMLKSSAVKRIEMIWYLNNILSYFEHLKYLIGFFLALFDLIDGCLDSNMETYFSELHYPYDGLYDSPDKNRRVMTPSGLRKEKKGSGRMVLADYLEKNNLPNIKKVFDNVMTNEYLRNCVAHRLLSIQFNENSNEIVLDDYVYTREDLLNLQRDLCLFLMLNRQVTMVCFYR
jgi:hypothetical protein